MSTATHAAPLSILVIDDEPDLRTLYELTLLREGYLVDTAGSVAEARALHANSHRHEGPWVAVNCGAIPEHLLEAEFFGARKGAYTGASQDRSGFFQIAHGGTLFLDEIGDLPIAMQAKLLRAIQERQVRALGASQEDPVDVRIVSATHKDLATEVQAGRFRQDLFYRLNVIDITLPPLRERVEDLPAICATLLERMMDDAGLPQRRLSAQAQSQLQQQSFPGNVRELENMLHRAIALSDGEELELDLAPTSRPAELGAASRPAALQNNDVLRTGPGPAPLPHDLQNHLDAQERFILVHALQEAGLNQTLAAESLGLSVRQIRYRIDRLKINTAQAPTSASTP